MTTHALVRDLRNLVLGAGLLSGACASQPARESPQQAQLVRAISPPARLEAPDYLPAAARVVLRTIMASHARNMGDLMSAIMVLDYPRIHESAQAIADDASLARPLTHEASELNSMLPDDFFRNQDTLRAQARVLVESAQRQSPYAVADAFGRVSETCVRCHYVYRAGAVAQTRTPAPR
jgi:cytochrome c556